MKGPSVLTLVRNRSGHFEQLVEGLRRSSMVPGELVVVDMSDVAVAQPKTDFPVTMVRMAAEGLALAAARNRAVAAATGTDLVFLDVDCIPMRDCLSTLMATLAGPDALVCADVRYLGPEDARGSWDEAGLLVAGVAHPVRDFPVTGVRVEHNPGLFWSLAFAVRRSVFDRLGGFDERFAGYGAEDTDFGFRADAAGLPLLFVGGAIACHQHHGSYDPPLQHFADIVRNARLFRDIWGFWPMQGWLDGFAALGLIDVRDDAIAVLRPPTADEIRASRQS